MSPESTKHPVGFLGLGTMGGAMARNLVKAGHALLVCDPDEEKCRALTAEGARLAPSASDVATRCNTVFLSLPHPETFRAVAENDLLPASRPGFTVIDMGTSTIEDTRRIAQHLADTGGALLDAPVSGGGGGAAKGTLRIFAGGDEAVFQRCLPLLHVLGDPQYVVYCGPSGAGQAVKGVNQLAMGLINAAALEAVQFGVRFGATPEQIDQAVGGDGGFRRIVSTVCQAIAQETGDGVGVKIGQLPHFLRDAQDAGFDLPISRALDLFCAGAEPRVMEANRWSPSFWYELSHQHEDAE